MSQQSEEYSVCQFFPDGSWEYVRRWVDGETAVRVAHHYCSSVGAKRGAVQKVIITDGGDCTVFEWQHGKGITFPNALKGSSNDRQAT